MIERYDDTRTPPYPDVVRRMKAYDCRLFVRFNLLRGWWELWRWRQDCLVPANPTPTEIQQKARLQYPIRDRELDHRVFREIWLSDMAQVSETIDPNEIDKHMLREDQAQHEADQKQIETATKDIIDDNKRQIRSDFLDAFSGYYPSTLS